VLFLKFELHYRSSNLSKYSIYFLILVFIYRVVDINILLSFDTRKYNTVNFKMFNFDHLIIYNYLVLSEIQQFY